MPKWSVLLIIGLVMPALWGALVHWLMGKLWPPHRRRRRPLAEPDNSNSAASYLDYQI
jgi:hypothetical protein